MERCDCDKLESLNLYIDGQLTKEEETELLKHVDTCGECKTELTDLLYVKKTLSDIPDKDLPAGFHGELMEKIKSSGYKKGRVLFKQINYRYMAGSAAVLFLTFTMMSVIITALSNIGAKNDRYSGTLMSAESESQNGMTGYAITDTVNGEPVLSPFMRQEASDVPQQSKVIEDADKHGHGEAGSPQLTQEAKQDVYSQRNYSINIQTNDTSGAVYVINSYAGSNIYSSSEYNQRNRNEIIRLVPANDMNYFIEALRGIGKVTYEEESRVVTTEEVFDLESRINAKRSESERLMEILGSSQSLEILTQVSARLSDVEYEIEVLESQLRTFKNGSENLTAHIIIISDRESSDNDGTFTQRVSSRFNDTLVNVTAFMENFLVWLALMSVPIAVLMMVAFAIFITRRLRT